jgi:hypothetical protein
MRREEEENRTATTQAVFDQHVSVLTHTQTSQFCVHEVHLMGTSYAQTQVHSDNDIVASFLCISKSHAPHCRH